MARRLRCPCGKELQLPDALAGKRFQCPACKRTLSAPAPNGAPAAEQSVSASRPNSVASVAAKRPAVPPAARRPSAPAPRSRWPWVAAIAAAVLLAGGGTAAWLHFKHKPADTPSEQAKKETTPADDKKTGDDKKVDEKKTDDKKPDDDKTPVKRDDPPDVRVPSPPFTLAATLDRAEVSPVTRAQLTVRVARAADFEGEIALALEDVPAGVTPTVQNIPVKQKDVVVRLEVAPNAKPGTYPLRAVGTAKDRGKDIVTKATADLVLVAPFALKVEPAAVTVAQGSKIMLLVTAVRKGGYEGAVALDWRGLPAGVAATKPQVIAAAETTAMVVLTAAADAAVGNRDDCLVLATIPDVADPQVSGKVAINVTAATVTTPPPAKPSYDLRLDPTLVKLAQGGKATIKVTATRREYAGPIMVELRNLPAKVTAEKAIIQAGQNTGDVVLNAAADAAAGDKPDVVAVGTTTDAAARAVLSAPLTFQVTTLFELVVDPTRLKLTPGGKATLKVTANRKGYTGVIDVELRNLPAGVTAPKVLIAKDATLATVELAATDTATVGDKPDVTAVGAALDAANRQILSDPFVLSVVSAPTPVLFEYQLDPSPLRLPQGGKTRLKVTVVRKDYQGPISVDLRNLPPKVTVTTPGIIAKGASAVDLELSAALDAVVADKPDVTLVGTAIDAANKVVESSKFTLSVQPNQGFDLGVTAAPYRLKQGAAMTVRVMATRRGYDGPITVELRGLPPLVTAPLGTIPQGNSIVDIQLMADLRAVKGDKPDVRAVGTATALPGKEFPSPLFLVGVLGAPSFDLTIDPGTAVVRQGAAARVKITAVRKDYDGPIDVELQGLPPGVTAPKMTLARGVSAVDVELKASGTATTGDKTDVRAAGAAAGAGITGVFSPNFTVSVKALPTFDLRVDTNPLTIHQAGKAKLKIVAVRKDFVGPIAVEVHKLPMHVSAPKAIIPAGKNEVEIEVSADLKAAVADKGDVLVHGSGEGHQADSPAFKVSVQKKK